MGSEGAQDLRSRRRRSQTDKGDMTSFGTGGAREPANGNAPAFDLLARCRAIDGGPERIGPDQADDIWPTRTWLRCLRPLDIAGELRDEGCLDRRGAWLRPCGCEAHDEQRRSRTSREGDEGVRPDQKLNLVPR